MTDKRMDAIDSDDLKGVMMCRCGYTAKVGDQLETEAFLAHIKEGCLRRPWYWWPRENPLKFGCIAFSLGVIAQKLSSMLAALM